MASERPGRVRRTNTLRRAVNALIRVERIAAAERWTLRERARLSEAMLTIGLELKYPADRG